MGIAMRPRAQNCASAWQAGDQIGDKIHVAAWKRTFVDKVCLCLEIRSDANLSCEAQRLAYSAAQPASTAPSTFPLCKSLRSFKSSPYREILPESECDL